MSNITEETTVFIEVCEKGFLAFVRMTIGLEKVDPSADNNRALMRALCGRHFDVCKLIISHPKFDVTVNIGSVVQFMIYNGQIELFKLLLENPKLDIEDDDNNAIRLAASGGHLEIVKLLLAMPKVDPGAKNNYALRWSITNDHIEVAKLLMTNPRVSINKAIEFVSENGSNYGNITKMKKFRDDMIPKEDKLKIAIDGMKTISESLNKLILDLSK